MLSVGDADSGGIFRGPCGLQMKYVNEPNIDFQIKSIILLKSEAQLIPPTQENYIYDGQPRKKWF